MDAGRGERTGILSPDLMTYSVVEATKMAYVPKMSTFINSDTGNPSVILVICIEIRR